MQKTTEKAVSDVRTRHYEIHPLLSPEQRAREESAYNRIMNAAKVGSKRALVSQATLRAKCDEYLQRYPRQQ